MYCNKCGNILKEDEKCCSKCGNVIYESTKEVKETKKQTEEEKRKAGKYIKIFVFCIACFYLSRPIGEMLEKFLGLNVYMALNPISKMGLIGSIVTIITAKIKCKNSIAIKILFWITIIYVALGAMESIFIIWFCSRLQGIQ